METEIKEELEIPNTAQVVQFNFIDVNAIGDVGNNGTGGEEETEDPLEICLKKEIKEEVYKEYYNENESEAVALPDHIVCCVYKEDYQNSDSSFKMYLNYCDTCYKVTKHQYKLEWMKNKCEWYKSCVICSNGFLSNVTLLNHDCTFENIFVCSEWDVMYDRKIDVVKHVTNFSSCDQHLSDVQNMTDKFSNQSGNVQKLESINLHKKSYACQCCEKSFRYLSQLRYHLRVHSGDLPCTCKHCDTSFNNSGNLKTHLQIHSGNKQYTCKHCDKAFNQAQHLKLHLFKHSGDKPYTCKHCDKSFNNSGNLKFHLRIHSGEKPYICNH